MSERQADAQTLFLQVIDKEPADRSRFLDDACRENTRLRAEVEDLLHALEEAGSFLEQPVLNRPDKTQTLDRHETPVKDKPGDVLCPSIPGYTILHLLGKGGMGVVYLARQSGLSRLVAVKMLLFPMVEGDTPRRRFQMEAEAIGRLQHPNVVQIYEINEYQGQPYFSMEYCSTGSLDRYLDGVPLCPAQAAQLLLDLANGIQAAHKAMVIHRDLKPGNVLLVPRPGETVSSNNTPDGGRPGMDRLIAKVTDFGLARDLDAETRTSTGAVMGTPAYMSPEQAQGQRAGVSADIYALGAILYECLTGRPPFRGTTALETLRLVVEEEPEEPRKIQPGISGDLQTICLKCLHKEPGQRYSSARALAEDLKRFLAGQSIHARPVSAVEKVWRWGRRRRLVASLMLLLLFVVMVGATVTTYLAIEAAFFIRQAEQRAQEEKQAEEKALQAEQLARKEHNAREHERLRADWLNYANQIKQARQEWNEGSVVVARKILQATKLDCRNWEYDYLQTKWNSLGQVPLLTRQGTAVPAVTVSPQGKLIVAAVNQRPREEGQVYLWRAATGTLIRKLTLSSNQARCLAFHPQGRLLAIGGQHGDLSIWDTQTGTQRSTLSHRRTPVTAVAWSPDGKWIASSEKESVRLWSVKDDSNKQALHHEHPVAGVAFSPSGHQLLSCGGPVVRVWNRNKRQLIATLQGRHGSVRSAVFSPEGSRIASVGGELGERGQVIVWDIASETALHRFQGHTDRVNSVAFSHDGRWVATGSDDQTVRVWDTSSLQQPPLIFRGLTSGVRSVCFSPDGGHIVSGSGTTSATGEVKVWSLVHGQRDLELQRTGTRRTRVQCHPTNPSLVLTSSHHHVKVWNTRTGEQLFSLSGPFRRFSCAGWSPNGDRIATGASNQVVLWNLASRKPTVLKGHRSEVTCVAWSPSGQWLASGSRDGTIRVWDAKSQQEHLVVRPHRGDVLCLAWGPEGNRLASGSRDGTLKVWDVNRQQVQFSKDAHQGGVLSLAWSPNQNQLATGGHDRTARIWNAHNGHPLVTFQGHNSEVTCLSWSPGSDRIVSGGAGSRGSGSPGEVKIWVPSNGQEVLSLRLHGTTDVTVSGVDFNADGRQIVAALSGRVKVWDANPPRASVAQRLARLAPTTNWYLQQAREARNANSSFAEIVHLKKVVDRQPWNGHAHVQLAWAARRTGQWDQAVLHHVQALLLDPGICLWPRDSNARVFADLAARKNNWTLAACEYLLAAHQPGAGLDDWAALMLCQLASRQFGAYRRSCAEVIQHFGHSRILDERASAILYCCLGPCGKREAQQLVSLAKDLAEHQKARGLPHHVGKALFRAGQVDEALQMWQKNTHSRSMEATLMMAMALHRKGIKDQPASLLRRMQKEYKDTGPAMDSWRDRLHWAVLIQETQQVLSSPVPSRQEK